MKRIIKFRIFDKRKGGRMVKDSEFNQYCVGNQNLCRIPYKPVGGVWQAQSVQHYTNEEYENCAIMQFTGLLDKNGVEIYEGDLLKHDLWGETEVIWDKEGACFRGKNEDHDITLAHHQLNRSRVTGNIYENKRS